MEVVLALYASTVGFENFVLDTSISNTFKTKLTWARVETASLAFTLHGSNFGIGITGISFTGSLGIIWS